jgi:hypothetical protein
MNEDRDTRDRDGESTTTVQGGGGWSRVGEHVWARAAEQALRDMARAQKRAGAHDQNTGKTSVP